MPADDEEEEEGEEERTGGVTRDFDYLLGMAIWSLTEEKVRSSFIIQNFD